MRQIFLSKVSFFVFKHISRVFVFHGNILVNGIVSDPRVEATMLKVDRAHYSGSNPYMDSPQFIGYGVTISAPHMVGAHSIISLTL